MNPKAMNAISYGLYILSAREKSFDNACVINTLAQVTSTPNRVSITVNKQNVTHDLILRTGVFNVSVLSERADFALIRRFGFQSGSQANKFNGWEGFARSTVNGVTFITEGTNTYLCGRVVQSVDLGTHTMFIADVTGGELLDDAPSATYAYYHAHIKPRPDQKQPAQSADAPKTVWRCKICGYEYEGDTLPEDYICPICKHGADDFERVER